jgi:hypothetical protein
MKKTTGLKRWVNCLALFLGILAGAYWSQPGLNQTGSNKGELATREEVSVPMAQTEPRPALELWKNALRQIPGTVGKDAADFPHPPAEVSALAPNGSPLDFMGPEPDPELWLESYGAIPGAKPILDEIVARLQDPALAKTLDLGRLPRDGRGFPIVTKETMDGLATDVQLKQKLDELVLLITNHVAEASMQAGIP